MKDSGQAGKTNNIEQKANIVSDFSKSAWADIGFAQNYLDKADIYIVERRKMFWFASSFLAHFFDRAKPIKLLELGCGDGVLTEELLKVNKAISATLVDGNEGMLQKARERLKNFDNLEFIKATFQDILHNAVELDKYDFCVSSMAIHHLNLREKASLFQCIASRLSPGGHFIDIDVVLPPSKELESWYFEIWMSWMNQMMKLRNVTDEVPEDQIRRYKDSASMNQPDTLASQLTALEKAGFVDVDCYLKNGVFVVFGGKLSASSRE
jgi:tRNA (cmo5U34)-methyltransferase